MNIVDMDISKLFPDEREKGETRLRQCHLVMLRLLKIFDYLCEKHKIKYFLVGGSLLGAIRHKGFIPWDDDLDIGMTRENFEKFERYAVPELPKDIFFQTPKTDKFFPACHMVEAKLKDKYSRYIHKETQKGRKWHYGLQLDIFVYDKAFLPHNVFIYALNRTLMYFFYYKGNDKRANVLKWIAKYSPFPLVYASSFICSSRMVKMGTNYIREKEISKLIKTEFEDMEVYIPQGWDECLKRQYGDYMKLPPPEQQIAFHGAELPDPFTPCNHTEILHWEHRTTSV
jgi:lipopolysaccharide cholinephosphotransferase